MGEAHFYCAIGLCSITWTKNTFPSMPVADDTEGSRQSYTDKLSSYRLIPKFSTFRNWRSTSAGKRNLLLVVSLLRQSCIIIYNIQSMFQYCAHILNQHLVSCLFLFNPYPTAFPYGNGMVLHFYQQQESSTTKTVHKVINKGLKSYV